MTASAALAGTFSDFKLIKSRGVAQLVIEVPLEKADAALSTLGGLPKPDEERWVALARLNTKPLGASMSESAGQGSAADTASPQKQSAVAPGGTKGGWYALKPSARAALLCKDEDFRGWVEATYRLSGLTEVEAADWLRNCLDVPTRARLNPDNQPHYPAALKKFNAIERAYRVSRGLETEAR